MANRGLYVSNSFARLRALANALRSKHRAGELQQQPRLLVLIDEYDRYANKLMLEDTVRYLATVKDKSQSSMIHPLRSLFETLKSITGIDCRTLVVGITPIALADASGANVWMDISAHPAFSNLCGFTEDDLSRALHDIGLKDEERAAALIVMKKSFNGYQFPGDFIETVTPPSSIPSPGNSSIADAARLSPSPASVDEHQQRDLPRPLYNSQMSLYFLSALLQRRLSMAKLETSPPGWRKNCQWT